MSRIVGYADIHLMANSAHFKRAALVTDEIRLTVPNVFLPPAKVAEVMWLQEKGAVSLYAVGPFDPNSLEFKTALIQNLPDPTEWPERAYSPEQMLNIMVRRVAVTADQHESDISATLIASAEAERFFRSTIAQRAATRADDVHVPDIVLSAYQLLDSFDRNELQPATALEVVLHQMPVPDDETAWEDILTWRSDEAAREKYRRLKHWVHNVVGGTERPKHLEDHLLTLLDDYRAHMRLHGMKVRTAQTKAIVVPILETVRDVFTGRWGEWAKAYFTVKEQQHALLEAELKAPGREVAYIVDAQERFGTKN